MESLSTSQTQPWLPWFLRGLLILGFSVLISRLIELQVVKGGYYRKLAEGNRIRRVPITAPRGKVIARGGEVIVGNREVRKRVIFDPESGYEKVDDIVGTKSDEIITEWVRDYKLGGDAAHITGYLGEVKQDEVGKVDPRCQEKGPRKLGSLVGRTGLEEQYECILSGIDGEELVEVDSGGNKIRTLGRRETVSGEDIKTTIHYGLQKKVAEIMLSSEEIAPSRRGAVIITDTSGQILALYSSPSYDPNIFVGKGNSNKIMTILKDKNLPLFNRVIGGKFHPGSVVKPVIATAALEEGIIDEDFIYDDTGQITIQSPFGTFSYKNWFFTQYGKVEGKINVVRAIARSTDTFFYKVGELLGIGKINQWAEEFGWKSITGIDIPGEIVSLIPNPDWKEQVKGERWFLGNTYHVSIGQGDIALTPLSVNTAISTIASGGLLCTPHIISNEESKNYQFPITNFQCGDLGIGQKTVDLVKEGMREACSSGGTGFTFFDFSATHSGQVDVACKTGTAETAEEGKTHAWFVAFAPVDEAEIVTTVLVEKGGEGSYIAGPVAREIFDYWFSEANE